MSQPASSIFRDALQVSPERLAAMGDDELNILMTDLLQAQAHKCRSPLSQVRVNTEGKAKDDGCDGWTAKPGIDDDWLGGGDTCWQFKAGTAGAPSRLSGEITKAHSEEYAQSRRALRARGKWLNEREKGRRRPPEDLG
jgi:hypothetical protein